MAYLCVDRIIRRVFYLYALLVFRWRYAFIVLPLCLAAATSTGLLYLNDRLTADVTSIYSPTNGQYVEEQAAIAEHWPMDEDNFEPLKTFEYDTWNDFIMMTSNGSDIIDHMETVHCVDEFISDMPVELKTKDLLRSGFLTEEMYEQAGPTLIATYDDVCLSYDNKCTGNRHIHILKEYDGGRRHLRNVYDDYLEFNKSFSLKDNINRKQFCARLEATPITYPVFEAPPTQVNLAIVVGGVVLRREANDTYDVKVINVVCDSNAIVDNLVISATNIRLSYHLRSKDTGMESIAMSWQRQLKQLTVDTSSVLNEALRKRCQADIYERFTFALNQINTLSDGLKRLSDKFTPNFAVAVIVLTLFATACSMVLRKDELKPVGIDWPASKPFVCVCGIVCVALGTCSAFGTLMLAGQWWNPVATVMPFLVISIGVDDMFIIVGSWHRAKWLDVPVNERFAHTVSDAAVSITITSLTDFLSFAIGATVPFPIVQMLASFAAAGVFFIYLYHVTFFLGVMACAAVLEAKHMDQQHSNADLPRREPQVMYPSLVFSKLYGPMIGSVSCLILTIGIYVLYIAMSIQGMHTLKEGLEPASTVLPDDPFYKHTKIMMENYWKAGMQMSIVVNNAPNLALPSNRQLMAQMEEDFKQASFAYPSVEGEETTVSFLRSFEDNYNGIQPSRLQDMSDPERTAWYYASMRQYFEKVVQAKLAYSLDIHWKNISDINNDRYHVGFEFFVDPRVQLNGIWQRVQTKHKGATIDELWDRMYEAICANQTLRRNTPLSPEQNFMWDENCRQVIPAWIDTTPKNESAIVSQWQQFWLQTTQFAVLDACRIYLVMANYDTATKHKLAMVEAREIAARYPTLNVSTYNEYYVFSDQYLHVRPTTAKNMMVALVCMMLVAIALIPDPLCACLCVCCIVSIDIGLLGFMSLWSVRLDCISMVTVIMSVGFAVDLTAHICYAYVIALDNSTLHTRKRGKPSQVHVTSNGAIELSERSATPTEETGSNNGQVQPLPAAEPSDDDQWLSLNTAAVVHAMEHLGWPVVQGALSTIFGMTVLVGVDAYSIRTFFKSVTLVCAFGLIHSVLFLPVTLIWIIRLRAAVFRRIKQWRK